MCCEWSRPHSLAQVEIRNPGFSLKSQDHLDEPGSQLRNPKIAAALYDTRLAETKGSGIRVMRESMEQAGLTPPLFESDRGNAIHPVMCVTPLWKSAACETGARKSWRYCCNGIHATCATTTCVR